VFRVISEVEKKPFRRIIDLEEVAPGAKMRLIHNPDLNLSNVLQTLHTLKSINAGAIEPEIVVLHAKHNHMSFAYCDETLALPEIQIVDVVPPNPSKLEDGIQVLHDIGMIPFGYPVRFRLIDESELLSGFHEEPILVPCRNDDLTKGQTLKTFSVDKNMHQIESGGVHVLGCQRTREAATAYGFEVLSFENMCPAQNLPNEGIFLAKCCLIRHKVEFRTNEDARGVVIPWGFDYTHLIQAATMLQSLILEQILD
jgi:hypothetical protein